MNELMLRRRMLLSKGNTTPVEVNLLQTVGGSVTTDGTAQRNLVFYPRSPIINGKTYRITGTWEYNVDNLSANYLNVVFGNYSTFHVSNFVRIILPGNGNRTGRSDFSSNQVAVANRQTTDIVLTLSIPTNVSGTVTMSNVKMVEV